MSEFVDPPSDLDPRFATLPVFSVATNDLERGQTLTCVSIKAAADQLPGIPDLPGDWSERLSTEIAAADWLIPEYFRPELENTTFQNPIVGRRGREFWDAHLGIFDTVADLAEQHNSRVAVADPANKPAYMLYEAMPGAVGMYRLSLMRNSGVLSENPDMTERLIPTATDARRMFTAAAIIQLASAAPDGSSFLYVGQPAHVVRVQRYVSQPPNFGDRLRFKTYMHDFPGVDKHIRHYEHRDEGWALTDRTPLQLPPRKISIAKQLTSVIKSCGLIEGNGKKPPIG